VRIRPQPNLTHSNPESDEAWVINNTNTLVCRLAIILASLCLPYYLIFRIFNLPIAARWVLPTVAIYGLSILLNTLRHYTLSKLILVVGTSASLFWYSNVLGESAGAHLLLFALVPLPLLMFEFDQRVWMGFGIATPIITYMALVWGQFKWLDSVQAVPPHSLRAIWSCASVTTFVILIGSTVASLMASRRYERRLQLKTVQIEQIAFELTTRAKTVDNELETARFIQSQVIPNTPPSLPNYHIDHYFQPAHHVSGDYFDYFPLSASKLGIIIADIVGKGIPASLMMMTFKGLVHAVVRENQSPSEICDSISRHVFSNAGITTYVPAIFGILDTDSHTFTYVNAGHEPAWLLHDTTATELQTGGMALGADDTQSFEQDHIVVPPGGRIVLFTDGITDITNRNGQKLGIQSAMELIQITHRSHAQNFVTQLAQELTNYSDGTPQGDDISMVSLVHYDSVR